MLGLDLEGRTLLYDIVIVAAGPNPQLSAVEFDDFGGQAAHEGAVMADEEQSPCIVDHHVLEPGNGFDVQMIGRLIQ